MTEQRENNNNQVRILYVLGLAYSGSTIFGLTIGRHSRVLNLGEVVNLENDYNPLSRCTCGKNLSECPFWLRVRKGLLTQQENLPSELKWRLAPDGTRSFLEEKADISRLRVLLGSSLEGVYGDSKLAIYSRKNDEFFSTLQNILPGVDLFVDLSKTPERLKILSRSKKLDIFVCYLKRNPLTVFRSNMKRPKRSRSKWKPKILRELMLQYLRTIGCKKIIRSIEPDRRIITSYENFVTDPKKVIDEICMKANIQPEPIDYASLFNLHESGQHIYVGNRWLFEDEMSDVQINQPCMTPKSVFDIFT